MLQYALTQVQQEKDAQNYFLIAKGLPDFQIKGVYV